MNVKKWIGSLCIFVSGYSPLALIYTIQLLISHTNWEVYFLPLIILWSCVVLAMVVGYLLISGFSKGSGTNSKIIRFSNKSGNLLVYTIPYIIAFLQIGTEDITQIILIAIVLLILFILMVKTNIIFINPFLIILDYNLYEVEYICGDNELSGFFLAKAGSLKPNSIVQKKKICENVYMLVNKNRLDNERTKNC